MMRFGRYGAAIAAGVVTASAFAGPEWVEQDHGNGDTGPLPSDNVQVVNSQLGGAVSTIRGRLSGTTLNIGGSDGDFEDMYLIRIDDPSMFLATMSEDLGGSTEFDSRMYLFEVQGEFGQGPIDGLGLLANDDTQILFLGKSGGYSIGSTIGNQSTDGETVIKKPGLYLLCVTTFSSTPQSAGGDIFNILNFTDTFGPNGPGAGQPITNWAFNPGSTDGFAPGNYTIQLFGVTSVLDTVSVSVDLKSGNCPNSFNPGSNGVLPAVIMGNTDFDVHDVDLSTVVISRADGIGGSVHTNEGPPGPHSQYYDKGTPGAIGMCECPNANPDGILDLDMKFKSSEIDQAMQLSSLPGGALVQMKISGQLNDGTEFEGYDCLRLVPPGSPPGQLSVQSNYGGAWVNAAPLDLQLDGGGFANFQRTWPQTTVTTLNTAFKVPGATFKGWRINGSSVLNPNTTLVITINAPVQTIEAVYAPNIGIFRP